MINVLIKDGNRTVNWDYPESKPVADILKENDFVPMPGTLRIGGVEPDRTILYLLSDAPQEMTPDGKQKRVVITMKPMPEKKPDAKKEGTADVC